MTAKESNAYKCVKDKFCEINIALHAYFTKLRTEHAEPHATRVVRERFGVALRAEEIDLVELPSSMTSRQLYSQFCYGRGWSIRANNKGGLPKVKDYPRRPFDNVGWPPGSMAKAVPSRSYFLRFWKKYYPKVRIRPPSEDTCNECWKYKNQLGVFSRRMQNDVRRQRAESGMDIDDHNLGNSDGAQEENNEENNEREPEEEDIDNLLCLTTVTDYSSTSCDQNCTADDTFMSQLVREEELLFTAAGKHVRHAKEMRDYCNLKTRIARECEDNCVPWSEREITEVGDYAQNEGVPHFGCEQPGDIYYFSPLGVYIFGMVRLYKKENELVAQYYYEGEGKKGGNNVASLLYNKINKIENWVQQAFTEGPAKSYSLIMDNCGGQNKNRMVIRFLLLLTEIGVFRQINLLFLVRGHTKNACDRMFMLLKQNFHKRNIYTRKQLHDNFNHNVGVQAICCNGNNFYDLDSILDIYYKGLEAGTVNRTHIFRMYHDKPCVIELQDSPSSDVSTQNLRKGDWPSEERVRLLKEELVKMKPMKSPGLRPIKVLELAKKWRPLVPEEFQDDLCPIPPINSSPPSANEEVNNTNIRLDENTQHDVSPNDVIGEDSDLQGRDVTANEAATTPAGRRPRRCGNCRQFGHNARTCPMAGNNP